MRFLGVKGQYGSMVVVAVSIVAVLLLFMIWPTIEGIMLHSNTQTQQELNYTGGTSVESDNAISIMWVLIPGLIALASLVMIVHERQGGNP